MSNPMNRRDFGRIITAATALPLGSAALAADKPPATPATPDDTTPAAGTSQKSSDDQPQAVDLLLKLVKRQYPSDRLDDAALDEIRDDLEKQLRRSRVLSEFPLTNADEPAFVFHPFFPDGEM